MSTANVPANSILARKQWGETAMEAHLNDFPMLNVMQPGNGGSTLQGAIVKETFAEGEGTTKDYFFKAPVSTSTVKTGDQRLEGTGKSITYGKDSITLDFYGDELQVKNRTMNKMRTKINIDEDTSKALGNQSARFVTGKIMDALLDTTTGRTRPRYLYGNAEANWNSDHATAMGSVDTTNGKTSINLIGDSIAKFKSQTSGLGFIQPAKVLLKDGTTVEKYIYLLHPMAVRDLKKDADFKTSVFNRESPLFDVISGSNFVGEIEGALIYGMQPIDGESDKLLVKNAGATVNGTKINLAHNLLLGAGAAVLGYGKVAEPDNEVKYSMSNNGNMCVTRKGDDHGRDTNWSWQSVYGFRKLVDGTTNEDFAVAHLFTSATGGL